MNDVVPMVVGAPDTTPDGTSTRPVGSVPATTAQAYGAVPPLAASAVETVRPAVRAGSAVVTTTGLFTGGGGVVGLVTTTVKALLTPPATLVVKGLPTRNRYEPAARALLKLNVEVLVRGAFPRVTHVVFTRRWTTTEPVPLGATLPVMVNAAGVFSDADDGAALTAYAVLTTWTCNVPLTTALAVADAGRTTRSVSVAAALGAWNASAKVPVRDGFTWVRGTHFLPTSLCRVTVPPLGRTVPVTVTAVPTFVVAGVTATCRWLTAGLVTAAPAAAGASSASRQAATTAAEYRGFLSTTRSPSSTADRPHGHEAGRARR